MCRLRAYSRPGLPSPTTSRSSDDPSPRGQRRTDATPRSRPRRRPLRPPAPAPRPLPRASRPRRPRPRPPRPRPPPARSSRVGAVRVATTVSGSSSSVDAGRRGHVGDAERVAGRHLRDVEHDVLGNLQRQRLDAHLAQRLREHAALPDARRFVGADEAHADRGVDRPVEPHLLQVDVDDPAAQLVDLVVLEDRGVALARAVDLDVENRVQAGLAGQRAPQLALLDRDRDRVAAARRARPGRCPACAGGASRASRAARARSPSAVCVLPPFRRRSVAKDASAVCRIQGCSSSCCRAGTARHAVIRFDRESGAWIFVCIHSTALGPGRRRDADAGVRLSRRRPRRCDAPLAGDDPQVRRVGDAAAAAARRCWRCPSCRRERRGAASSSATASSSRRSAAPSGPRAT